MTTTLPEINPYLVARSVPLDASLGVLFLITTPIEEIKRYVVGRADDNRFSSFLAQVAFDAARDSQCRIHEGEGGTYHVTAQLGRVTGTTDPVIFTTVTFTKDAINSIVDQESFEKVANVLGYEVRHIIFNELYGDQFRALRPLVSQWRKDGQVGPRPTLDYTKPARPEEN